MHPERQRRVQRSPFGQDNHRPQREGVNARLASRCTSWSLHLTNGHAEDAGRTRTGKEGTHRGLTSSLVNFLERVAFDCRKICDAAKYSDRRQLPTIASRCLAGYCAVYSSGLSWTRRLERGASGCWAYWEGTMGGGGASLVSAIVSER